MMFETCSDIAENNSSRPSFDTSALVISNSVRNRSCSRSRSRYANAPRATFEEVSTGPFIPSPVYGCGPVLLRRTCDGGACHLQLPKIVNRLRHSGGLLAPELFHRCSLDFPRTVPLRLRTFF